MKRLIRIAWLLVGLSIAGVATGQDYGQKDIVLILDNSGSMKKHDPQFLLKDAVTRFLDEVTGDTRLAVIIFDSQARVAVPFTPLDDSTRGLFLESLEAVNYRGQFTNSPKAVERAIYELKTHGRDTAQQLAVYMTDGIVDTGNTAKDAESSRWMREELADDAAVNDIQIFGVAFTENADFQTIQSLALKTGADYYRAYQAADLAGVFERIREEVFVQLPPPVPVAPPISVNSMAGREADGSAESALSQGAASGSAALGENRLTDGGLRPASGASGVAGPGDNPVSSMTGAGTAEPAAAAPTAPVVSPSTGQTPAAAGSAEAGAPAGGTRAGEGAGTGAAPQAGATNGDDRATGRTEPDSDSTVLYLVAGVGGAIVIALVAVLLVLRRGRKAPVTAAVAAAQAAPEPAVPARPAASLLDLEELTGEPEVVLDNDVIIVGRQQAAHPGVQSLVIPRTTVGRQHAIIEFKRYQYWIIDQNSTNGTFVNGQRIAAEQAIVHGDRIRFHNAEFVFQLDDMVDTDKTAYAGAGLLADLTAAANAESAPEPAPARAPEQERPARHEVQEEPEIAQLSMPVVEDDDPDEDELVRALNEVDLAIEAEDVTLTNPSVPAHSADTADIEPYLQDSDSLADDAASTPAAKAAPESSRTDEPPAAPRRPDFDPLASFVGSLEDLDLDGADGEPGRSGQPELDAEPDPGDTLPPTPAPITIQPPAGARASAAAEDGEPRPAETDWDPAAPARGEAAADAEDLDEARTQTNPYLGTESLVDLAEEREGRQGEEESGPDAHVQAQDLAPEQAADEEYDEGDVTLVPQSPAPDGKRYADEPSGEGAAGVTDPQPRTVMPWLAGDARDGADAAEADVTERPFEPDDPTVMKPGLGRSTAGPVPADDDSASDLLVEDDERTTFLTGHSDGRRQD